jgi:hypothetical protein
MSELDRKHGNACVPDLLRNVITGRSRELELANAALDRDLPNTGHTQDQILRRTDGPRSV